MTTWGTTWLEIYTLRYADNSYEQQLSNPPSTVCVYNFDDHYLILTTQFRYEEDAEKAVQQLNNRWFNGLPIHAELSPVTDFREACCRQYEMG